jgi:hypothetical protein
VPFNVEGGQPSYLIVAGLVFTPLTEPFIESVTIDLLFQPLLVVAKLVGTNTYIYVYLQGRVRRYFGGKISLHDHPVAVLRSQKICTDILSLFTVKIVGKGTVLSINLRRGANCNCIAGLFEFVVRSIN